MVKRVLMIAYHFPPYTGGSGIQRTLKFSEYLPQSGWQPIVLTASACAYRRDGAPADAVAAHVTLRRSFALDSARHLALRGRYPALLALPDRWISWWLSAVPAGLALIRRHRPDVIWSSYPIATAHLIGLTLHRLSGLPWIADQRDPMSDDGYPADPRTRRLHRWIEAKILAHSASMVCTTPGAVRAYRARFPLLGQERFSLIENGYDEADFAAAPAAARDGGRFRLLHSGAVYPSERDPSALFAALARLRGEGVLGPDNFQLVLRASGHDAHLRALAGAGGVAELVELAPPLPYRAALAEMQAADGLLLLQAANCNAQIPAKLYEYLRAGRPLLALTDPAGDSAAALRRCGIDTIGKLDSASDIAHALTRFLSLARQGRAPLASAAAVALHSRQARSIELAALLERVGRKEET
ncbi:glycosyltransferase [Janthinobacterium fluminis]|uniref:Glycosyltransferase n=1 Tax=Janthinobacterium fluminis TaxID=2987524 RepID=A0ABT5JWQ2_9BURK|nr:glycosyltransferase [Janthinobacterium fluminis]MDC8756840.1 glycosyltransferase [Janthinobacterium fluminis]